jgi:ATP-binding cassette subfamily B protein
MVLTEGPRMPKRWWLMTANARIRANVRANALRGVIAWPMAKLQATPVGDFMSRIIGDVEVLGVGVREFIIETWDTVLFSISLIVAMLVYDANLTVLAMIPVVAAMLLAKAAGRWVGSRTTASREASASLTSAIQEQLSGIRVLRLFGRAGSAVERVSSLSERQADANLSLIRLRSGLRPIYTTMMTAGVLLVVWQGGERVVAGAMTVGAFVAYLELYLRFVNRGFRVPQMVNSIQGGSAAYARLRPLLAPPPSMAGEPPYASFRAGHIVGLAEPISTPRLVPNSPVSLSLRDLAFRYPGNPAPVLRNLSLEVPAGALVAVTGPVGSGKSALARAILGLYPLESGQALWDSRSLEDVTAAERAAHTGYLPQDPYLFSGTVRENIMLGAAAGGDEDAILDLAVRCAALEDDLQAFPQGLETEIGERGIRVSGGQRQRIALARAIANTWPQTPGLLVLDDPFSAVDLETESAIIASLRQTFGPASPTERRCTILLFSHRLAAFPQADLIVVLEGGRIVEEGTHAALSRNGGLYARIYHAQLVAERGRKEETRLE